MPSCLPLELNDENVQTATSRPILEDKGIYIAVEEWFGSPAYTLVGKASSTHGSQTTHIFREKLWQSLWALLSHWKNPSK